MIDEINYRCYRHQREKFPEVSPKRWARIFENAEVMEEIFQQEFADQGRPNTGLTESTTVGNEGGEGVKSVALPAQSLPVRPSGREGVSGSVEGHAETQATRTEHYSESRIGISGTGVKLLPDKCRTSENQASPTDSQSLADRSPELAQVAGSGAVLSPSFLERITDSVKRIQTVCAEKGI